MLLDLVRSLKDQVSSLDMQNYEKKRTEYLKDGKVQQVVYLVPDHCLSELKASWSKILYDLLLGGTGTNGSKRARPGESKPPPALHAMHVSYNAVSLVITCKHLPYKREGEVLCAKCKACVGCQHGKGEE